jgi:hypothetical protein
VRHLYYLDYRPSQDAAAEAWKPSPDDVTKHSKA